MYSLAAPVGVTVVKGEPPLRAADAAKAHQLPSTTHSRIRRSNDAGASASSAACES